MTTLSKPLVVSRLNEGDVIQLLDRSIVKIITLTADYKRTTISTNKTATVQDVATGAKREIILYGNQRYSRVEGDVPMSDAIVTTETTEAKSFEQQMQDALALVEAQRKQNEEKNRQERARESAEFIVKAKPFVDWLGLPGELAFDDAREAAFIVYQGITFLIHSSLSTDRVFINVFMFRDLPIDEDFKSNWQSLRHEIRYGWADRDDKTRSNLLAEIAEYIPQINAAYDAELKRHAAWKERSPTAPIIEQHHTVLIWHNGSDRTNTELCAKLDAGYRIVSVAAASEDGLALACILLSKLEHPVVRQRVIDVSEI